MTFPSPSRALITENLCNEPIFVCNGSASRGANRYPEAAKPKGGLVPFGSRRLGVRQADAEKGCQQGVSFVSCLEKPAVLVVNAVHMG